MKISSSFEHLVDPSTQNVLQNAGANAGMGSIRLVWTNENTDKAPIYDCYDENEYYVFSIDTENDTTFER